MDEFKSTLYDDEDNSRLWFGSFSEIPEYTETVNYPIPLEKGEMYFYYWNGEKWIDTRYLDHFPNSNN